ncbi:MAG: hypothetical protein IJX28_03935 [Clostridia bacterium]|nr:hypothetical protein [Clostridia bacterium]
MKQTSVWARILCLVLMLSMVAVMFVGCGGNGTDPDSTNQNGNATNGTTEETGPATDADGYLLDALPEDLNFNREMKILCTEQMVDLFAVAELSNDVVGNAVYRRWTTVEDRLGIEITWVPKDGLWNSKRAEFIKMVETTSTTGDAFDGVLSYNLFPGALAQQGLVQNLGDTDYIDLTMPWWPQSFLEEVMVNDVVYGLVESSSKATLRNLHGVFFNNTLIESYNLESPYDLVNANEWTFDRMMEMVKGTWSDLNSNGTKDDNDFFGVVTGTQAKIETWFVAMGYRYSQRNSEGIPELIMNDAAKMTEWIDAFNVATDTNDFLIYDTKGHTAAFFTDRAILYMSSIQLVEAGISKQIEMDYGVVPVPKKDENQERYLSNVANTHDIWSVPIECDDLQESAAMIECMASESYRQVAPVYFEACVKLRYAPDGRLAAMYDMIRDSITFDFCQIYSFVFNPDPRKMITDCTWGSSQWASQWASYGAITESSFQQILALYGVG